MVVVGCLGVNTVSLDNGKRLEKICKMFGRKDDLGRLLKQKDECETCCLATLPHGLTGKRDGGGQ